MPKGSDWVNFIYINLAFVAQVVAMFYFTAVKDIKDNWPKYRCNPMYMPLSDDIQSDFVYCIQSMQTNYMGYLLQPLTYITSNLSAMGAGFVNNIDSIRNMMSNIRTFLSTITEGIFGVFLNIIISFQKIMISIKDLVGKMIGVMVAMMYIMDGSLKTINSSWNGPPGQMVRALGKCFHPETKIKLNNGKIINFADGLSEKEAKLVKASDLIRTSLSSAGLSEDTKISRPMYDALTDLSFNIGEGGLAIFVSNIADANGELSSDLFAKEIIGWTKVSDPDSRKGILIRRISQLLIAKGVLLPEDPKMSGKKEKFSYSTKNMVEKYLKTYLGGSISESEAEKVLKDLGRSPPDTAMDFVNTLKGS
jgi:hypothetical protein